MPDSYFSRQTSEEFLTRILNREIASFAFGALVSFPGLKALHQSNRRAVSKGNLLVTTANTQNRLIRRLDYLKHTCQRFRCILIPRLALTAQNNVGRLKCAYSVKRDFVKRLGENLDIRNETSQHTPQFTGVRPLTV